MRSRLPLLLAFLAGALAVRALGPTPVGIAAGPADFTEVVARADASVVHVTTRLPGQRVPGSRDDAVGAGFVFSSDGLVATSAHVLTGAEAVFVTVAGRPPVEAQVLGQDPATDVAVLRVPLTGLVPLPIGDPSALRVGQWVLTVGSPFRLPHSYAAGIVSGLGRSGVGVRLEGYEDFIQTDAAANLGNSGGPLLDASGRGVGMVAAILSRTGRSEGITLAVPIDVALEAARRLAGGGGAARPTLGVVVREVAGDARLGGDGLEVTRFHHDAPAEAAGLRAGDVIVSVDGQPTPRAADLQRLVWAHPAGTALTVVFRRAGRLLQVAIRSR
jgi:serine protease Do